MGWCLEVPFVDVQLIFSGFESLWGCLDFECIPLSWVVVPAWPVLVLPALLHLLFPTLLQFLCRCGELDGKMKKINPAVGWKAFFSLYLLFFLLHPSIAPPGVLQLAQLTRCSSPLETPELVNQKLMCRAGNEERREEELVASEALLLLLGGFTEPLPCGLPAYGSPKAMQQISSNDQVTTWELCGVKVTEA